MKRSEIITFILNDLLGKGTFGDVIEARIEGQQKRFAIKIEETSSNQLTKEQKIIQYLCPFVKKSDVNFIEEDDFDKQNQGT